MNILVTGANGQLGNEMRIVTLGSDDHYIFTDVVDASAESVEVLYNLSGDKVDVTTIKLDITDLEAVRTLVKAKGIDVIVNCAAYTNVDGAETNQELAELLNAKAPENLAVAMKEVGGVLIHISSDYVFSGNSDTPYSEEQECNPTGVYGLTKLHGEHKIIASGCQYIILRTAWLYSEFGKNFVKTILNLTATRPQLKVVFDQVGTPTYALDLAKAIFDIIEHRKYIGNAGIYHYSNEGVCSWCDFAKMIAELSSNTSCDIQPCTSSEFPSLVKRPAYSVLDKTKVKTTFGLSIPYWIDSLTRTITRFKS